MSYYVIRHAAIQNVYKFMKVTPDAVYFQSPNGSNQLIIRIGEKFNGAKGNDILTYLRNETIKRGYKVTSDELVKAANEFVSQASSVKHSDDDPDILTDDDVEIIEAPYPENGKAQIPKRSFIYDDEDGYPQDYFEHHGILGMKWGVRRYQNKDGSLTDEGRKRYNVKSVTSIQNELGTAKDINEKREILTKADESAEKQRRRSTAVGAAAASTLGLIGNKSAFEFGSAVWDIAGEIGIPSAIAEDVFGTLAFALATPVGKIALIGAGSIAAATSIYSVYKKVKVAKMAEDLNRSEAEKPHEYKPYGTDSKTYKSRVTEMLEARIRNDTEAYNKVKNSFEADEDKDRAEWEADVLYGDMADEEKKKK